MTPETISTSSVSFPAMPSELVLDEEIGRGSTCTVYSAMWNCQKVAAKIILTDHVQSAFPEIAAYHQLSPHRNVMSLLHHFILQNGRVFQWQDNGLNKHDAGHVVLLFEKMEMTLQQVVMATDASARVDAETAGNWIAQILFGIQHLHGCGVVHRDIKSSNIFVHADGHLVLGDLGFCYLTKNPANIVQPKKMNQMVGSPFYMAPELFQQQEYTETVDLYSFGCTIITWYCTKEWICRLCNDSISSFWEPKMWKRVFRWMYWCGAPDVVIQFVQLCIFDRKIPVALDPLFQVSDQVWSIVSLWKQRFIVCFLVDSKTGELVSTNVKRNVHRPLHFLDVWDPGTLLLWKQLFVNNHHHSRSTLIQPSVLTSTSLLFFMFKTKSVPAGFLNTDVFRISAQRSLCCAQIVLIQQQQREVFELLFV